MSSSESSQTISPRLPPNTNFPSTEEYSLSVLSESLLGAPLARSELHIHTILSIITAASNSYSVPYEHRLFSDDSVLTSITSLDFSSGSLGRKSDSFSDFSETL